MKQLISIEEILKRSWKTVTSEWRSLLTFLTITISIPILGSIPLILLAERRAYGMIRLVILLVIIGATAYFSLVLFNYLTQYVFKTDASPWLNTREFISAFTIALLYVVVVITGLLLFIIPGIWLGIALAFSLPIYLHEKTTIIGSMKKSWKLVQGRWWNTAVRIFLPNVLWFIGVGFVAFSVTVLFMTCAVIWLSIMTALIHMSGAGPSLFLDRLGELIGILAIIGMFSIQLVAYFAAVIAKISILLETNKSLHQTHSN